MGRGFGGEGHSVNILQNGEGQTSFMPNWRRVMGFFGKEKITPRWLVDSYLLTNSETREVYRNPKLVYTSKATSKN